MKWQKDTPIRRIDNPSKIGQTTGVARPRAGLLYYGVRWADGTNDYVAEDQLELQGDIDDKDIFELIKASRYGRADDLRRNLTHVHLSGKLANLVYSMGVTNTDFYPHQYKPLLTLLESPASGLLIADEVGLGKTIEAGIVWTELRAREDMRRLLVICPAMLREKWRDELKNRFGIESTIVDARSLSEELIQSRENNSSKAWIASYQALRPPKSWQPGDELTKRPSGRQLLAKILDENSDENPLLDLAIFDEAHYMRNISSSAHKLGTLIQATSHYRILLSATPINLDNTDLFSLLKLCDPDHFQYPQNFQSLLTSNKPLVAARDAALRMNSTADEITENISKAAASEFFANSRQIASLLASPPTDFDLQDHRYRSELASSLERINLLGHVITRTRKRDVQIVRPKREVHPERVEMSHAERRFYNYVTDVTRDYAWQREISDGFLLATPQRQVCSCPAAFALAWLGNSSELIEDMKHQVIEECETLENGDNEILEDDIGATLKDFLLANRPRDLDLLELEKNDSKLIRLTKELRNFFKDKPNEKVIIFTSFRATAKYLCDKLDKCGMPSMLLWGGMATSKQELINEFRESRSLRILVSTEVASEGVDLQFSRLLVNYDLPWNPMRVEQRIGRIDRLGQNAKVIHIWNLFYRDTIDERIFTRLLSRLKIFQETLGELDPVIGDNIQKLESKLLTTRLTPDQENAEIERVALALENVRQRQEELEKNASQMMAHGGMILERISAARELSRRVTENDLIIYVADFLRRYVIGHQFLKLDENNEYSIQLSPDCAAELDEFCRRNNTLNQTRLCNGLPRICRFVNSLTTISKSFEIIHQFHPLIRFISYKLNQSEQIYYPLVALQKPKSNDQFEAGDYIFVVRKWSFSGVKEEEWLQVAVMPMSAGGVPVSDAMAETLINEARLYGEDWLGASVVYDSVTVAEKLDILEVYLSDSYKRVSGRKQDENADRLMLQLHGIEMQLNRDLSTLMNVLEIHRSKGRHKLIKATQGRIQKLNARMELKRQQVKKREILKPDDIPVCVGLLRVY